MINIEEKFKSGFTGRIYIVKRIIGNWVIMETANGIFKILTDQDNIQLFYSKIE